MKSENEITTNVASEIEVLKHHIYEVRGLRVMLDRDLAELYGVQTKALNQAVKRAACQFAAASSSLSFCSARSR